MSNTNELFINDQISVSTRALIPETLKRAYGAANLIVDETPFLQIPSVLSNKGRLYSWAVDFAIEQLIKSGSWDCDYQWKNYAKPTGRYLEVRLPHSRLSISRVSKPKKQPRDVRFRSNMRMENQLAFLPEINSERIINGLPHILLVHGGSNPDFAHLGVPNSNHALGYLCQTTNLMLSSHIVIDKRAPIEDTDYEDDELMQLKEEIEKWLHDNDI